MARDTTRFSPEVGSLYSFVELSNLTIASDRVAFTQSGGITSGYNWSFTGYSKLQYGYDGNWYDSSSEKSGTYSGYGDKTYDTITDYFLRYNVDRIVYVANYAHAYVNGTSTSARAYIAVTVPALPPDATTLTATRNSDTSVALAWTGASGVKESVRIERSTDGGAYSEIAYTSGDATSYTDSTTSADHKYTYRIRYYNQNAYGAYSSTASVTMAPTAPTAVSLTRSDATNVVVSLTNASTVATSIQWQESLDNGTTWGTLNSVSGSPVTSFTAATSGGTVVLRVRNVNSVGSSAWIVSDAIVTITPPNPPTLISPSGVFNMSGGSVTFTWLHNPKDGSAQTAAQLAYSTNGGSTWTTVTKTTEQSHTITPIPWAAGTTVTWRVRTKGADASYGSWASSKQFTCYQVPSLTFAASNPPSTITSLPIPIQVTYSDPQNMACAAASVAIQKDGRTVYTEALAINGNTLSGSIDAAEFLPENGESYTIVVTARSGSSLQASTNMAVTVAYVAPALGTVDIQNDPDTGYVSLLATFDNDGSDIEYSGSTNTQYDSEPAYVKSLTVEGQSAKWNQVCDMSVKTVQNATLVSSGTRSYTVKASQQNGRIYFTQNASNILVGHSYYVGGKVTTTAASAILMSVTYGSTTADVYAPSGTNYVDAIAPCTSSANWTYPRFTDTRASGWDNYTVADVAIVDLTAMFGSGNEPATVDAFKATDVYKAKLAAGELYDYDAGSLVSIGSVGLSGRNLLPKMVAGTYSANGATVTVDSNGVATFSGKTTSTGNVATIPLESSVVITQEMIDGGIYMHLNNSEANGQLPPNFESSGGVSVMAPTLTPVNRIFSVPSSAVGKTIDRIRFWLASGITVGGTFAPALMYGSTAHAYEPYSLTTIPATLRSAGSVHDQLIAGKDEWTVSRKVGIRAYQSGDESDPDVLTDGTATHYALATPTTDTPTSYSTIQLGTAFTVGTELDSTFSMTSWDGAAEADTISVSRVNADGTTTPLLTDGASGSGVVDKYAPLNTEYTYEVVTYATSGAYAVNPVTNTLDTTRWFAYWGDNIAWAKWNPSGSYSITRPEKKRVHYAGRKWPVSYDSKAIEQSHSMSWQVVDMEDWQNGFKALMDDGGRGVYKGCDGNVFHADFDYNAEPNYTSPTKIGKLSLTITRIDGEQL